MNFLVNSLSQTTFSYLNDHFLLSLTPTQKKIIALATTAFACLALSYVLIKRYYLKDVGVEENPKSKVEGQPYEVDKTPKIAKKILNPEESEKKAEVKPKIEEDVSSKKTSESPKPIKEKDEPEDSLSKTPPKSPEQIKREEKLGEDPSSKQSQDIKPVKDELVTVKTGYRKTLDQAFVGQYAIDQLPFYLHILTPSNPTVQLDQMTQPVMRGKYGDSHFIKGAFIAIAVVNQKNGEEKVITLYSTEKYPEAWKQVEQGSNEPIFFNGEGLVTYDNGDLQKKQEQNFKLFQTLLKEGKGQDVNGETWCIATHIGADEESV